MPVHNSDISGILNRLADLLEIDEANPFRIRSYREAARTVDGQPRRVAEMLDEGEDLSELHGIGSSMVEKIEEIVETGKLRQLEELEDRVPGELSQLMKVSGLGPKRVKLIYEELGVSSRADLVAAAEAGKLRGLEGLGEKTEEKILAELAKESDTEKRSPLFEVEEAAEDLLAYLRDVKGVKRGVIAGSYRRRKETVGDLDILVTCRKGSPVMDRFIEYDDVAEVISRGSTRSSVRLRSDLRVDVRVMPEVCYGAALQYFTGSKAHNVAVRRIAVGKKLKINEYGVFRGDDRVAGKTEEEVYEKVGLTIIPPELRENQGEVEAAMNGALPRLVGLDDIRGDLHCHTKASDGNSTLEEMAQAAKTRGYEYLAITEHSKRLTVASGLDEKRLRKHISRIDELNEKLSGARLLKGIEVDILEDGTLDLADDVLAELDIVICSIHSKLDLPEEKQTARMLRAMENPHFNVWAHPTGRMLGRRGPIAIDLERVFEAAVELGCFLEVNSQPDRLDLKVHPGCLLDDRVRPDPSQESPGQSRESPGGWGRERPPQPTGTAAFPLPERRNNGSIGQLCADFGVPGACHPADSSALATLGDGWFGGRRTPIRSSLSNRNYNDSI